MTEETYLLVTILTIFPIWEDFRELGTGKSPRRIIKGKNISKQQ
jgi:hypothetical protein